MLLKSGIVLCPCFWRVLMSVLFLVVVMHRIVGRFPPQNSPSLEKFVGRSLKLLVIWAPLIKLFAPSGVPSLLRAWLYAYVGAFCVNALKMLSEFFGTRSGFFGEDRLVTLINGPKPLICRTGLYAGDRALQQNNCFSMKLGISDKLKPMKIKLCFHIKCFQKLFFVSVRLGSA